MVILFAKCRYKFKTLETVYSYSAAADTSKLISDVESTPISPFEDLSKELFKVKKIIIKTLQIKKNNDLETKSFSFLKCDFL